MGKKEGQNAGDSLRINSLGKGGGRNEHRDQETWEVPASKHHQPPQTAVPGGTLDGPSGPCPDAIEASLH